MLLFIYWCFEVNLRKRMQYGRQFRDEDSARGLYDTTKSGLQDNYKEVSGKVETSKNSGSYAKYTIQVDGGYVTIARIDNTLLYAKGLAEHKDDIKDAVEELGY